MTVTEADALVCELEAQRNFLGTRAVRYAANVASLGADVKRLTDANAEKQTCIEALQAEVEALKAQLAALTPHDIAGQE